ncbi:MAG TPA: hypothetical protein VII70_06105 [Steroidobacteraceae bacterium]
MITLYARFGAHLARALEQARASRQKINRGFTLLNKVPRAKALARKRLSPVAQGYLEGLCE